MRILFVFLLVISFASFNQAQVPTRDQVDAAASEVLPDDPAAVIAVIGNGRILMGDIAPKVEARISDVLTKTNETVPEDQLHFVRVNMTRGLLQQAIQSRTLRESFLLEQVGTQSADKRREAEATMNSKARQMFFESELPELMKQYKVQTNRELDAKLREKGTSLSSRQREFTDQMLGHFYIKSKVSKDPSVSLSEIFDYYQQHQAEYTHAARARWEQLTVKFDRFKTKQAAYDAIWAMGREAFFGGSMTAVAKEKSQEPFASDGGLHGWTNQGALVSRALDTQIFSLPMNAMSQIIEDVDAYHIIRVLEREPAGITAIADVQDEIRNTIRERKINEAQVEVLKTVQQRVPVWTIFPQDVPGSKPLTTQIAGTPPEASNR